MSEKVNFKPGDKVIIKYVDGVKPWNTPRWCFGWTGTVVRLNPTSVTVEFEVNEPGQKTINRRIDYMHVQPYKG